VTSISTSHSGQDKISPSSTSSSSVPLSYLVEAITEHDAQLLDELQQLVERKRNELRDRELRNEGPENKGPENKEKL